MCGLRQRTGGAPVRLEVAGYLAPTHARVSRERERDARHGRASQHEFDYRGELDRDGKLAFLRALDVLSVPATYDEPKAMFLLEAMASGVPVVQPRRGAFIEVVDKTGGGILVAAGRSRRARRRLHRSGQDRDHARARSAAIGVRGVRAHYTIAHSADRLLEVYESLLSTAAGVTSVAS